MIWRDQYLTEGEGWAGLTSCDLLLFRCFIVLKRVLVDDLLLNSDRTASHLS